MLRLVSVTRRSQAARAEKGGPSVSERVGALPQDEVVLCAWCGWLVWASRFLSSPKRRWDFATGMFFRVAASEYCLVFWGFSFRERMERDGNNDVGSVGAGRFGVGASSCRRENELNAVQEGLETNCGCMVGGGGLARNPEGDRDGWRARRFARSRVLRQIEKSRIGEWFMGEAHSFNIDQVLVLTVIALLYGFFVVGTPGCRIFWCC